MRNDSTPVRSANKNSRPLFDKESGLLLHPSSLPGKYGIGEIGPAAHRWIEALARMNQSLWQILPLGPTGYGDSPYQTVSTYATNRLLISLEVLADWGLLTPDDLDAFPAFDPRAIDYGPVIAARNPLLLKATSAFAQTAGKELQNRYRAFRESQAHWLEDFSLFVAIKESQGGQAWTSWPKPLRDREAGSLAEASSQLAGERERIRLLQFFFDVQWSEVRNRARRNGIRLIGDIPIFVSHDSADVWANRSLFHLKPDGQPKVVAGVPPDYFSATGQRWGNPLYDWNRHREEGFEWWTSRMERMLDWVDVVRIDHFLGFSAYWEIPAEEPTAVKGRWIEAPGREMMLAVKARLGELPIIAEDLGLVTEETEALREELQLPGMRVVQFDIADDRPGRLPDSYSPDTVAYTATHDNETLRGWYDHLLASAKEPGEETLPDDRDRLREYLGGRVDPLHWRVIEELLKCPAGAVVFPLQDVLGLGTEGRMNVPGRASGNWKWRFCWEDLTEATLGRLADLTRAAGRNRSK